MPLFRRTSNDERAVPVEIYSRRECHLCDVAEGLIESLALEHHLVLDVRVIDVDSDAELRRLYGELVPVVFVDGKKAFKFRVDPEKFVTRVRHAASKRRK
ncbi:MAG: glutaredoxin family protein [Thermoanaerobaculia bacterium]